MSTSTPNAKRRKTNNGKENGNENGASADANNNRTKHTSTALVPPSVTTKQSKADTRNTHTRKRKIENIQSSTSRVPCCPDCAGICLLCSDQKAKERKAAQVAKKAAQVAAKAAKKAARKDGKIQCIKCETCQKILTSMSQHGTTRRHNSLNDNKKCVGTGEQGAVVWLSQEDLDVKRKEYQVFFNKQHYQDNKEKKNEYSKQYYQDHRKDNKEKVSEYNKQYYQDHKIEISQYKKQYGKQYRKDNKEKISEYGKQYSQQYYQDNRDRILKNNQIYKNKLRAERMDTYELAVEEGFELGAITRAVELGFQFIKEQVRLNPTYEGFYILLGASHRLPNDGDGYKKGSVNHNGTR